jgi:signal peptidase II
MVGAAGLLADQLTKLWAICALPFHQPRPILGQFLRLSLIYNPKGVFGLPLGSSASYSILSVIGIGLVLCLILRAARRSQGIALGFVLGGAIGNLIDRVRLGRVTDFIDVGIGNLRWPTFNLADSLIVVGIIIIIAGEVKKERKG